MKLNKILFLILAAALVLGIGMFASCDDDDDDDDDNDVDDDDNDTTDDDTADDDSGDDDDDDDDDDDTPVPGKIGGTVKDFLSEVAQESAAVEALDAATGASFDPPVTGTSDANGYILLDLPASYTETTVGIKVEKSGYKITTQFGFLVGAVNETFLCISNGTFGLMSGLVGETPDPSKGHVAGAVYWGDPSDETPIGCADVVLNPDSGNVYYFNGLDLPTPGRSNTNPDNGLFVAINTDATASGVDIEATADGNTETSTLPVVIADSVSIQNVYFSKADYATNPQEAGCSK